MLSVVNKDVLPVNQQSVVIYNTLTPVVVGGTTRRLQKRIKQHG